MKKFLVISILCHLALLLFVLPARRLKPFQWGGGKTEPGNNLQVIWIESTKSHTAPEAIIKKKMPTPVSSAPPARGEGNSLTPTDGVGDGYDSREGKQGEWDLLAAIRSQIERAKQYPLVAERKGLEGEVKLEFELESDGRIKTLAVVQSSGHPLLDAEAIATLRRAAPYPYVAGPILVPLQFALHP